MGKYFLLFLSNVAISLEYRARIVSAIVTTVISILVFFVFWLAAFQKTNSIGELTLSDTILYYTLAPLLGFITSVHSADQIGSDIKNGTLSNRLIKPISLCGTYFSVSVARKIATLALTIPIYALIIFAVSI